MKPARGLKNGTLQHLCASIEIYFSKMSARGLGSAQVQPNPFCGAAQRLEFWPVETSVQCSDPAQDTVV